MRVFLKPGFTRLFDELPAEIKEEAYEKIELFKDSKNHRQLHVHKLHGRMKNYYSFSITYKVRIVFQYEDRAKKVAILFSIGSHDIYQ